MPRCMLPALAAACLVIGNVRGDDAKELNKFQGSWKAEKALRDGNPERAEMRIVVADRKLTILANGKPVAEAEITIHPATTPPSMELKPLNVKGRPTLNGIYEFDGESLRISWAREGGERPKEFGSKPETKTVLFELKREKQ